MKPFKEWPDPKNVCEGEYSVIHEFVNDLIVSNHGDPEIDVMVEGTLREFIETASTLLYPEDVCPKCGSDEIEGGHVVINAGKATQECNCLACGQSWTDIYAIANKAMWDD